MPTFKMAIESENFLTHFLNLRNAQGQSPLFLTVQHGQMEMFTQLYTKFKDDIDFMSKEQLTGNTALHVACLNENQETAQTLFDHNPDLCMVQNYLGRSPLFLACSKGNLDVIKIFETKKREALEV